MRKKNDSEENNNTMSFIYKARDVLRIAEDGVQVLSAAFKLKCFHKVTRTPFNHFQLQRLLIMFQEHAIISHSFIRSVIDLIEIYQLTLSFVMYTLTSTGILKFSFSHTVHKKFFGFYIILAKFAFIFITFIESHFLEGWKPCD